MNLKRTLSSQLRSIFPLLMALYIPILLTLGILVVINLQTGIKIAVFTRDPLQITNAPFYYGFVSNLGILLWAASAAVCLFSFAIIYKDGLNGEWPTFLLFSGLLTSWLLLDDLFLFHEEVFPNYLNVPERVMPILYIMLILVYLARFRKMVLMTEFSLLIFSLGFFGLSNAVDLSPTEFHGIHLIEDGAKLFGIVTWAAYFIRICLQQMRHYSLAAAKSALRP